MGDLYYSTRYTTRDLYKMAFMEARTHDSLYSHMKKQSRELWAKVEELKNQLGEDEFK
jgi:hypothetical protein